MRLLLSLGSKQFLSGLAPNAHTETGGLFFKADGVTPLYDAGGTASVENGLLQAGPAAVAYGDGNNTGATADAIFCGEMNIIATVPYLWMMGASGHFYLKQVGSGDMIDRASANPIANSANGMAIWGPAGGAVLLYYWQKTQIGTFDMSGNDHPASPDTHWVDNAYPGLNSTANHPTHKFVGNVYYGNGITVGALTDAGSGTVGHSTNVLDYPARYKCTALSDDGTYLVVAVSENSAGSNTFATNKIYFWDTFSNSWTREWTIRDPYVFALQKIGNAVYAFGQYGIWEVSFGGVKKVLSRLIGFGTMTDVAAGYGANRAIVYNDSALLFATDTTVDTFGKLAPDLNNAYFKHFKIPLGRPTFVSADLDVGRVYVATTSNRLYSFDFNGATRNTGVLAQTVYIPTGTKVEIEKIKVIFGEPLASGDSMSIQLKADEDTTAIVASTSLTASYAQDGAIRSKPMRVNGFFADEQLSIVANFVAGAVKIKRIEIWGDAVVEK